MKIIQISDLHFGTEQINNTAILLECIAAHHPRLVIISGDFTQNATSAEFKKSREFLNSLPCPAFCVPGNHDIPSFNIWKRIWKPFAQYSRFISPTLDPTYEDAEVVISGLNTARPVLAHWNWANGAVSGVQRNRLKEIFSPDEKRWTICVMHHPIHRVAYSPIDVTVFGHNETMNEIKNLRVDLVTTGHVHHASITTIGDENHQTVYLSASTALSSRVRGDQSNGYNVITLYQDTMTIECYALEDGNFVPNRIYEHKRVIKKAAHA